MDSGLTCDGCDEPLYVGEVHDCPVLGTTVGDHRTTTITRTTSARTRGTGGGPTE